MSPAATQDVFELVLARPVVSEAGEHEALVHLWWRAPQQAERLVQVYVNGRLYDVSADASQREMWLMLDRTRAHRIELLAVDPRDEAQGNTDVWRERRDALNAWQPSVRDAVELAVLRDESLAVDATVEVSVDGEARDTGPLWPSNESRTGFGALFGEGGFGFDAATGPGLGEGELGYGPLGADGTAWRWRDETLDEGTHAIELAARDARGEQVAMPLDAGDVTIERLPRPPRSLTLSETFVLSWE